jgi:hypothetical protein
MVAIKKRGPGFRNQVLPTLASFGHKAPRKIEDLAHPCGAWYATHFSRDWARLYLNSMVAVEHMLKTTILRRPGQYHVPNILERWSSLPVRRSGKDIRAFDRLSEILTLTVSWMKRRYPTVIKDVLQYTQHIEGSRFAKPDSKTVVTAQKRGERDWVLYRWKSAPLVIAVLDGPNPLGHEISTANFPADLQPLFQPGRTLMAIMKIPGGQYLRYQLWSPEFSHMGIEEPWYAANFLQMNLAADPIYRKRAKRYRAMQFETIPDKAKAQWWDYIAGEYPSLDFSLLQTATDQLAENGNFADCLTAFFPDAKHG